MTWPSRAGWIPTRVRWGLAAGLLLVVLFGANALWDYVEAKRVTAAIVGVSRMGGTINRMQLERVAPVEPADDAAPFYVAAASLASTGAPYETVALGKAQNFSGVPGPDELQRWYSTGQLPAALLQRTRAVLDRQAEALRLLDEATTRRFRGFQSQTAYGARLMQFEQLCRLCDMRTVYAAATGNGPLAVQSLRAELALFSDPERPVHRAPLPHVLLSTLSLSLLLNRNALDETQLASLALAFGRADDDRMLERDLDSMRGGYIAAFLDRARYFQRPIGLAGLVAGSPAEPTLLPRPLVARRLRDRLDAYAELIAASRLSWTDRLDQLRLAAMHHHWRDDSGFLVNHGWSSDPWGLTAVPIKIESARVARAAIAVERYRLAHHGQLPDTLDQTVPMYLPDVPIDPYSGRPIRFVKIDGGYEVYGVSFDRTDDGGDLLKDQPVIRVAR